MSVLDEAAKLVDGDRQAVYGDATVNHQRIANLWNARFAEKMRERFTAAEVACAMRLVKEARLMQTPGHTDSLVDIAAYAEVEARIHAKFVTDCRKVDSCDDSCVKSPGSQRDNTRGNE